MLIEKKLSHTEKKYGYLFWESKYDEEIKQILKNTEIDVKIGNSTSLSRSVDLNRRRIYIGSDIKNIKGNAVRIKITPKLIDIECV